MLKNKLSKCNFVCILTDASNHDSQKMVPLMIRYFIPNEGIKTNILEFGELTGETALQLTEYISNILTNWNIKKSYSIFN